MIQCSDLALRQHLDKKRAKTINLVSRQIELELSKLFFTSREIPKLLGCHLIDKNNNSSFNILLVKFTRHMTLLLGSIYKNKFARYIISFLYRMNEI